MTSRTARDKGGLVLVAGRTVPRVAAGCGVPCRGGRGIILEGNHVGVGGLVALLTDAGKTHLVGVGVLSIVYTGQGVREDKAVVTDEGVVGGHTAGR